MVVKGAWTGPYADCNVEGDTKECAPCFSKRKCFLDPEKLYYSRCESQMTTSKAIGTVISSDKYKTFRDLGQ